jgi:hypothetical protein
MAFGLPATSPTLVGCGKTCTGIFDNQLPLKLIESGGHVEKSRPSAVLVSMFWVNTLSAIPRS